MRSVRIAFAVLLAASTPAFAGSCPGNPDAIGTTRTITVDPKTLPQIGTMQYAETLPLQDHEVVITFDDGPLPPYTTRILDILAENCVKVNYFLVGSMAREFPDLVRRIYNSGHVIGTHSLHHPFTFNRMDDTQLEAEVDGGIAAVENAVGDARAVAPFFRIPGLLRSKETDAYLGSKSLSVFSADEVADDWRRGITPKKIVALAMKRLNKKNHRGVLLLHDIHPATVMALPMLLKELKENGYKIVQAVPGGERPASVPEREHPATTASGAGGGWPRTIETPLPRPPAKHVAHHHRTLKKHVRLHRQKQASEKRRWAKNSESRT
jgi:peptidoglycan/xylan/chitin deacetylase (PgdA/CDA1 family)